MINLHFSHLLFFFSLKVQIEFSEHYSSDELYVGLTGNIYDSINFTVF